MSENSLKSCRLCGKQQKYLSRGMCHSCYNKYLYRQKHGLPASDDDMTSSLTKKCDEEKIIFDLENTDLTYEQIGKKYGVSRQRVHQILCKHKIVRLLRP